MLKTASEILSESFQLYKRHWREFIPYIAVLFLPTLLLSILGALSLYLSIFFPASDGVTSILIVALFSASLVTTIWASIALIRAARAATLGQPLNWKENLKASNHVILPFIWVSILTSLIVLGGTILFIIPGIIFAVWYNFAVYAVALENARGMNALSISKSLVVGRWWSIAGRLAIIGVVSAVLVLLPNAFLMEVVKQIPIADFLQEALGSLLGSFISMAVMPISTAASVILFYSAKENPVARETPTAPPSV